MIAATCSALATPHEYPIYLHRLRMDNLFVIASVYSVMSTPDDLMKAKMITDIEPKRLRRPWKN